MRTSEFNKYCYPLLGVSIVYLVVKLFTYFLEDEPPVRLVSAFINLTLSLAWVALKKWSPRRAILIPYVYLLVHCILTILSFRDMLPEILIEKDKTADETKIPVLLIITHTINYNPFLVSLLVPTTIILVSSYLQYIEQVKIYRNPYSGLALETEEQRALFL